MVLALKSYEEKRLRLIARECKGQEILDIGYAQMPNHYLTAHRTTGIDLMPPKDPSGYAEEVVGDATQLSSVFGQRTFDTIIASELIEHLENPYEFLRSLHTQLKPGGRLILTTPNPIGFPCLLFEWVRARKFFYTRQHLFYFAPRWVERMLDVCHFKLIRTKGVGLWAPFFTLPLPATLSYQVIYVATPKEKQLT